MKLVSLNIEGDKHLKYVIPFLKNEMADVVCLQEVFEDTSETIAIELGMERFFAPMMLQSFDHEHEPWRPMGVTILSKRALKHSKIRNYWSPSDELLHFNEKNPKTKRETQRYVLASGSIEVENNNFVIGTTHFTWTPDGKDDPFQERDANFLLSLLEREPEIALCGDFNIPRDSNKLYAKFAERFTDAIPKSYKSSLDMKFHRMRDNAEVRSRLETYMVDYLFLTPAYAAKDVRLQDGVSDHKAIVATIQKA